MRLLIIIVSIFVAVVYANSIPQPLESGINQSPEHHYNEQEPGDANGERIFAAGSVNLQGLVPTDPVHSTSNAAAAEPSYTPEEEEAFYKSEEPMPIGLPPDDLSPPSPGPCNKEDEPQPAPQQMSVSTALRPLTPIANTNLFLNVPYKIFSVKHTGCFLTWYWRHNNWWGNLRTPTFVCSTADQKEFDVPDSSWVFERSSGDDSLTEYDGTVKIRNLLVDKDKHTGGERYLRQFRSGTPDDWRTDRLGLGICYRKTDSDLWAITSDPKKDKSKIGIRLRDWWSHGHCKLNPLDSDYRSQVYLGWIVSEEDRYPFTLTPVIDIQASLHNFKFKGLTANKKTTKKDLLSSYEITNPSPATITQIITVQKSVTDEFSWGLSESFKICKKVKAEVGLPIAKKEVEVGFELTVGATQNWKTATTKQISMSYTVAIPAWSKVQVSAWYDLVENIKMPYECDVEMTGTGMRMSKYDDLIDGQPVSGEMIRKYLADSKFEGTVVKILEKSVIVRVKGELEATAGINGVISVNGRKVAESHV